jgi:hypothetical protein
MMACLMPLSMYSSTSATMAAAAAASTSSFAERGMIISTSAVMGSVTWSPFRTG